MVETSSFIVSLVFSSCVFVLLFGVYIVTSRRPGNAVIYHPLRLLREEDVGAILQKRGPFSWATEAWSATEDDLVDAAGLDATVYLHLFTAGNYVAIQSLPRHSRLHLHNAGHHSWTRKTSSKQFSNHFKCFVWVMPIASMH